MKDQFDIHNLVSRYAPILHFHPREGEFCCYPSNAEEVYASFRNSWEEFIEDRQPKQLLKSTPCYYEFWRDEKLIQIRYWIWYQYNDFPPGKFGIGKHVGDWENIEVRIYNLANIKETIWLLSNHYEARLASLSKTIPGLVREDAILVEEQINVWSALGSHANYPSPLSKPRCYFRFFCDEISDGGLVWNTQENLKQLDQTNFSTFKDRWGDKKAPRGPANEYNSRWRNAPNYDPI